MGFLLFMSESVFKSVNEFWNCRGVEFGEVVARRKTPNGRKCELQWLFPIFGLVGTNEICDY